MPKKIAEYRVRLSPSFFSHPLLGKAPYNDHRSNLSAAGVTQAQEHLPSGPVAVDA